LRNYSSLTVTTFLLFRNVNIFSEIAKVVTLDKPL